MLKLKFFTLRSLNFYYAQYGLIGSELLSKSSSIKLLILLVFRLKVANIVSNTNLLENIH